MQRRFRSLPTDETTDLTRKQHPITNSSRTHNLSNDDAVCHDVLWRDICGMRKDDSTQFGGIYFDILGSSSSQSAGVSSAEKAGQGMGQYRITWQDKTKQAGQRPPAWQVRTIEHSHTIASASAFPMNGADKDQIRHNVTHYKAARGHATPHHAILRSLHTHTTHNTCMSRIDFAQRDLIWSA